MWFGSKKQNENNQQKQVAHRHQAAHPQGGFNLSFGNDKEGADVQKATSCILKQLGSKLLTGNFGSLLSISKPIAISHESSFLNGLARGNTFSYILDQCSDMEPLEQIKYICAFYIGGMHVDSEVIKMRAPLDPLIGETIQLTTEDQQTQFYAEQVAFDPPIIYYQVIGQKYKIWGCDQLEVNIHKTMNSLSGIQKGKFTIKFNNGAKYTCTQSPTMELTGLVMGDRIINWSGKAQIDGPGIRAIINFNYATEGMMSKLTGFFKSQEQAKIYDIVEVDLFEIDTDGKQKETPLCQGIGSWVEDITFDEKIYWQMGDNKPKWISTNENVLESDTSKRQDFKYMKEGKFEDAQTAKYTLEEQNIRDMKLRKQQLLQ